MNKWILYNFTVGFTVYWASNLLLWFPWSVSAELGMILMLTVSPLIWAISCFYCLKTFPKEYLMNAAFINSIIFLFLAVVQDFLFFGLYRNALEELYHPTTLYGYGFLIALPFIIVTALKKMIEHKRKIVEKDDFIVAGGVGLFCFAMVSLIILFDINIS